MGEALPDYLREATTWLGNVASALTRLEAPVVTAVHGFAAGGGGFGLVCASDIVVAAESRKFLLGATRVGMAPDAGGSVTLANLVGLRKAMEITLLNPTIDAAEALEIGLVTRSCPTTTCSTNPSASPPTRPLGRPGRWRQPSGCSGTAWGHR